MHLRLRDNASAFDIKRPCVSLQTQGRFSSNASAFWMERKGVWSVLKKVCKHLWKRTSLRFVLNAKTFYPKRTCVSLKTYLRLNSNALAFFYPWSVLKIVVSFKINSWQSWQVKHYIPKKVVSSAKLQQKLNIRIFSL